jgi:hypothetical protein
MNNALKWLISDLIGYVDEGNEIIAKTPTIVLCARQFDFFVSWIILYKKKKLNIIGEIGDRDNIFYAITSFIKDVDKERNDADNS